MKSAPRTTERPVNGAGLDLKPAPPSGFACRLEEQPDHLVPEYWLAQQESLFHQPLLLNPDCTFGPDDFRREFLGAGEVPAWVRDQGSGVISPFVMRRTWADYLLKRTSQERNFDLLPLTIRRSLICAGILIPEGWAQARRREWNAAIERGAQKFLAQGFLPTRGLIHPFMVAALRRYYRRLIRSGRMRRGDVQCPDRYVAHCEPVAVFFHHQLAQVVSGFAQQTLKPSYVYLASYQPGAALEMHTDRKQCEISVSLCIDYSPEPRATTPWPIQLHFDRRTLSIFQALGDGLLYRGGEIPHSRDRLPVGHTSTSIFFHYVSRDFTGTLR